MTKDSAKGAGAGYLFQYQRALLLLTTLESSNEFISIEMVDDVAKHDNSGILLTVQVKHSIRNCGNSFTDSSTALWRTLEIWITKLEKKIYTTSTHFVCSSNRPIASTSFLYKVVHNKYKTFEDILLFMNNLLDIQKAKEQSEARDKFIEKIEFVLSKSNFLKIIVQNLKIEYVDTIKEDFYNSTHLNSTSITDLQRENVYHTMYGWIMDNCIAKWSNNEDAIIYKSAFDSKYISTMRNSSVVDAIFRRKKDLLHYLDNVLVNNYKRNGALFVRQISDISRNEESKERIIEDAINDFICSEIELKDIIEEGNYTEQDFKEFSSICAKKWQKYADTIILEELSEYSDREKNSLAVKIFDFIMNEINLKFDDTHSFHENTRYIQNGTFLKLSDIPEIGWHPDWKTRYKK